MTPLRTTMLQVTACTALLAVSLPASAQDSDFLGGDFYANIALTTDYTFRGISQSSGDFAVQGGIDWASDLVYVGVWASTVDFNDDQVDIFTGERISDGASTEVDFYFGVTPMLGSIPLTFGFIYYAYPGAPQDGDDTFIPAGDGPFLVDPDIAAPGLNPGDVFIDFPRQNYWELQIGTDYAIGPIDLGATISWSPDYYLEAGNSIHTMFTASAIVADFDAFGSAATLSIGGHFGYLEFLEDDKATATNFFEDYVEYSVGATVTLWGIDFNAKYVGASRLPETRSGRTGVFTVSKSF